MRGHRRGRFWGEARHDACGPWVVAGHGDAVPERAAVSVGGGGACVSLHPCPPPVSVWGGFGGHRTPALLGCRWWWRGGDERVAPHGGVLCTNHGRLNFPEDVEQARVVCVGFWGGGHKRCKRSEATGVGSGPPAQLRLGQDPRVSPLAGDPGVAGRAAVLGAPALAATEPCWRGSTRGGPIPGFGGGGGERVGCDTTSDNVAVPPRRPIKAVGFCGWNGGRGRPLLP